MSDIRFNRWLHQSGTGGVYQASSGNVGIGTSVPSTTLDVNGLISATSVTATTGTITGNLSVGGVLTYEDVTNIDAVGVVTARAGVKIPDSQKIFLGTADDLQIYHDGSESYVAEEGEGGLTISSGLISFKNQSRSETHATMTVNSGVSLFHNNLEKFKTTSGGIRVLGDTTLEGHLDMRDSDRIRLGASDDLQIFHNGSNNYIDNTSDLYIRVNGSETAIYATANGKVALNYDGSNRLETTSAGIKVSGSFPDITIHDTDTTNDNLRILHNGGGTQLLVDPNNVGPNASHFIVGIDGTERLRITSTGQLKVGNNPTINSGDFVQIEAPTSFNSGETIFTITGNSSTTGPRLNLKNLNTGANACSEILGSDAGGQSTGYIRFNHTDQTNNYGDVSFGTRDAQGSPPSEKLRIKSGGEITSANLSINGYAHQNTPTGYSQFQSDNHANTIFGQNLKLGTSAGNGNHQIEIINQHPTVGGAGMYIGGNGSNQQNQINFYAEAANQSAGTDVTANRRAQIGSSAFFTWVEPRNLSSNGMSYLRTFGFTFNLQDGETETLFYNPDGYRRIYYEMYVQSAHGSNGYGYVLANTSRYGTLVHESDWHVSHTSYAHSSSVGGNVNHNGIKFTRSGYSNTNITYYVIVKCFSPAGGNPYSNSGLTDPSYRYFNSGY